MRLELARALAAASTLAVLMPACGTAMPSSDVDLRDSTSAEVAAPLPPVRTPVEDAVDHESVEPRAAADIAIDERPGRPEAADRATSGDSVEALDDLALIADAVAQNRATRIEAPEPVIEQVWLDLAECESNQRWDYNGSSGYDGGLQFLPSTWDAVGGRDFAEFAWQATPFEQVTVAKRLLEVQGWGAWPACSRKLGLR